MSSFQAVFYRGPDGREPVADFVQDLPVKPRVAIKNQLGRLNLLDDNQPHLPFPHSSQLEGEIRELRCHHGRTHMRVLYARSDRLIILLHAFVKSGKQVPAAETTIARDRWADFRERMNAQPRVSPRAAGHDAP